MPDEGLRTGRRRVRRATDAAQPFMPWGIAPLIGLLLALGGGAAVAKWQIEAVALDVARDALREAGLPWVEVEASGQWISLESEGAARDAEGIVLAATAGTWVGDLPPITHVTSTSKAPPPCEPAPAPAPAPPSRDWSFRLLAGELTLAGSLPDEASKAAVLEAARAQISPPKLASVKDELSISGLTPTEADRAVALRGVSTVGRCDSGEATWKAGVFSLRCELARAVEPEVRKDAIAPLSEGTIGEISLLVSEEIASCEGALAEILQRSTIEFATGSAEIRESSRSLLDEVASEAKKCPGNLRVEGHTDDRGEPAFNLSLSEKRAESVRGALVERGLAAERLLAVGFGDSKPKDSNTTEAGRSHNRRIEIKVVRSHE